MLQQIRAGTARAAAADTGAGTVEPLLKRIRGEFFEMPGMCLTVSQAARLWNLAPQTAERALRALVAGGFLSRTDDGRFVMARWTTR